MGYWIDILQLGATGESGVARQLLNYRVPLALRGFAPSSIGCRRYVGPVPQAVSSLIRGLPRDEASIARSYAPDLIDGIVDEVVAGIEKPLLLVELCRRRPTAALEELVTEFNWPASLKRSQRWKHTWVSDMLRSMEAKEVKLPRSTFAGLGNDGRPVYEFNEIAYAVAPRRILQAWRTFKHRQNSSVGGRPIGQILDMSLTAEKADYCSVTIARSMMGRNASVDVETLIDLHRIGARLVPLLIAMVDDLEAGSPKDGYKPIAWHNVFWDISSDYEGLRLELETRVPCFDRDQELADFIARVYPEVIGTSRQTIQRRRTHLQSACVRLIREALIAGL